MNRSCFDGKQPEHGFQQGRFPCSVWTEDHRTGTLRQRETDIVEHHGAAPANHQAVGLHEGAHVTRVGRLDFKPPTPKRQGPSGFLHRMVATAAWPHLTPLEQGLVVLWFLAVTVPLAYAVRARAPFSLGIVLSVLFGAVVQTLTGTLWRMGWLDRIALWSDLVLVPARMGHAGWWHTAITSGFLHAQWDLMHVLGNVVILALVGVPLEQRLGTKRFAVVYLIGLLGGSIAWTLANAGSGAPAWGASGAAFGLLGAYLAGWPKDEIPFPLILIRPWPVSLIALLYFGIEIARWWAAEGGAGGNVAHMAHLGGFVACYVLLPLVAKGGPVPRGVDDGGPSGMATLRGRLDSMRSSMVDLSTVDDPWSALGHPVPKAARGILATLQTDSDEPEVRLAWFERLADAVQCPVCQGPVGAVERSDGPRLQCASRPQHLDWPPSADVN